MTEEEWQSLKTFVIDKFTNDPFVRDMDIKVESVEPKRAVFSLDVKHNRSNMFGIVHGGVLMTLADVGMGAACFSCNKKVVTLEANMSFLRSAPVGKHLIATGSIPATVHFHASAISRTMRGGSARAAAARSS